MTRRLDIRGVLVGVEGRLLRLAQMLDLSELPLDATSSRLAEELLDLCEEMLAIQFCLSFSKWQQ